MPGQRALEKDPSVPDVDMTGDQLLKHAKVYTLAEKFGLPDLKSLASSKIHCVNSTAKGEIAYARYVYEFTPKEDTTIRTPVAAFWAARSHTLRSEAEEEFRSLCLKFPQFGYDVLSMLPVSPVLVFGPMPTVSFHSPRARREAQAREERKDASRPQQRAQAPPSQQHRRCRVKGMPPLGQYSSQRLSTISSGDLSASKPRQLPCRLWGSVTARHHSWPPPPLAPDGGSSIRSKIFERLRPQVRKEKRGKT